VYFVLVFMAGYYGDASVLDFDFFSWGDMIFLPEIAYAKVAPHWYFRIFMN